MDFADILTRKNRGVARIVINRPQAHNAPTTNTMKEMLEALRDAEFDSTIGVVVLYRVLVIRHSVPAVI